MFISAIKTTVKNLAICLALTVFCIIFTGIYEIFSYGEYSAHMRLMFIFPLLAGIFTLIKIPANKVLFNSALAVFANGFLVKGIIEISGRTSSFDYLYLLTGALILIGSFIFKEKENKPMIQ